MLSIVQINARGNFMLKDKGITVAVGALGASIHLIGDKVSRFNGNSQYLALIRALCRSRWMQYH